MDNKIAVITGAGRGLGRTMATLEREQGACRMQWAQVHRWLQSP